MPSASTTQSLSSSPSCPLGANSTSQRTWPWTEMHSCHWMGSRPPLHPQTEPSSLSAMTPAAMRAMSSTSSVYDTFTPMAVWPRLHWQAYGRGSFYLLEVA